MDNVQVQRAGGLYKARFAGQSDFTFGENPRDAASKLRLWKKADDRPTKKLLLAAKFRD